MDSSQLYRSQSLRRVQQFLTDHAGAVPTAAASDARRKLDSAIGALDAAAVEQGTHDREIRGEVRRRHQLERTLVRKYMTPLAKFARASLKGVPQYAELTPSARGIARERLVKAALSMANAADKHAGALASAKFPADFLTQLRSAASAVKASVGASTAKQVAGTGATKAVETALAQGRRAVAELDSLVSHLILGDERLEREWRAAKRVRKSSATDAGAAPAKPTLVTDAPHAPVVAQVSAPAVAEEVTKAAA